MIKFQLMAISLMLLTSFGLRAASEKIDYDRMLEGAIIEGNLKKAEEAIAHGADVNGLGFEERITRLNLAISLNRYDITESLLKAGADVNLTHGYSDSPPLSVALFYKRFDLAQLLLKYKANVNQVGSHDKTTPLITLANSTYSVSGIEPDSISVVKQLISLKADINSKDTHGWHALDYAVNRNKKELVTYLLKLNAQIDRTAKVISLGYFHVSYIREIEYYKDLHVAIKLSPNSEIISILLKWTPDISKLTKSGEFDTEGNTLFHWAAARNNQGSLKILLDRNRIEPFSIELLYPNYAGETALDLATANNNQEIVKMISDELAVWQAELKSVNNFMPPLNKIILEYLFGRITAKVSNYE